MSLFQLIIFISFCINATMALNFFIQFIFEKKPKLNINRTILFVLLSSAIWSIGMGLMSIQTDYNYAYFWRSLGILGTFMFMMSVQKTLCIISQKPKRQQTILNGISYSGLFVYLLYITPGQTIFTNSAIGTTFHFRSGVINVIYALYYTVVSLNLLYVTISMIRHPKLARVRTAGKRFLFVEILIFSGAMTDMVMPVFGLDAYPGSAITHFWGVFVFWFAIHDMYKSQITIANMSEYIYYSLDIPVLVFDSDYHLIILNDASSTFFDITTDTFVAGEREIDELFFAKEDIFDFEDRSCIRKMVCKKSDAKCEVSISKIKDAYDDTIGYILITTDLTEHELVIQKLEQAKLAADSANMSKSLFLANMSHEIRTPMNAILGFSEIALSEDISPQSREYFTEIKQAGDILLSIINSILDLSKIELGKQELNCTNYKTARLLKDVEMIVGIHANKKGLDFSMNVDPSFPEELYGDRDKIREILINLLNNAVKYTPSGRIEFSAKVLTSNNNTALIQFNVSDTGMGIKEEDLPTVFDKFQRLDANINSKTEGTGLGLSITKGLVELMNGNIYVKSIYGVGSTFTVELKQNIVNSDPIKFNESTDKQTEKADTSKKVTVNSAKFLVVDDNIVNLKVSSSLLKNHGIVADLAKSGFEALDKCKDTAYDIILLDQMMPEMDGIETMQKIRQIPGYENGSSQKIVALTANVIDGVKEDLLNLGFDSFLGKPMNFEAFNEMLIELLPEDKIN